MIIIPYLAVIPEVRPIQHGTICELVGQVGKVGILKLEINVKIFAEQKYTDEREKAVEGIFTFAAIDKDSKPTKFLDYHEYPLEYDKK